MSFDFAHKIHVNVFYQWSNYFRSCPVCGFSLGNFSWLCTVCEKELLSRLSLKTRWINQHLKHHYLLDWSPQDGFVGALAKSLKGRGLVSTYENLALVFMSYSSFSKPNCIYYPSKGKTDHAYQWAFSYGKALSCPIKELHSLSQGKQALKRRSYRQMIAFDQQKPVKGPLVFVDDIVTTGATAVAAWKALNRPRKLTIWSLFYRRIL